MSPKWSPFYLRPTTLLCYGSVLILLIVLLQTLLAASQRNQGLAPGQDDLRYLWTYGPTALMTVLTAFWARVEFQAQSVTPWIRMSDAQEESDVKEALLLDYTSMLKPVALFKSFKNCDWIVGIAISGQLVSQLAVALSTGLLDIDWRVVDLEPVPVVLETAFSNDTRVVEPFSELDLYASLEVLKGNAPYPRGTTSAFAYQTVRSELADAELRTTVDGFTVDMACEPASLSIREIKYIEEKQGATTNFSATLTSPSCVMDVNFSYGYMEAIIKQ